MQDAICQKIPPQLPSTELWQVGIVHRPAQALLAPGALAESRITWLPAKGSFRFIADPFGMADETGFTLLAEALDYRIKRGEIHYYRYDRDWNLTTRGVALRGRYHLSYPFLIRHEGQVYMLPEAHRSGKLTLYRAARFPDRWEPMATLLNLPAIDASILRHEGRWWMFYALPGGGKRALSELHIASADDLMGPWVPHPRNPVRQALDSARPGGTPFVHDGNLYLPTQDCRQSYGDAITLLRIDSLTQESFAATPITRLSAEELGTEYNEGLHTFAACGEVTLIDTKRTHYSAKRRWINLERKLRRALMLA